MSYYNFRIHTAGRRAFLRHWWRLYQDDGRWTPPPYSRLLRALNPAANSHLARLQPRCLYIEAMARGRPHHASGLVAPLPGAGILETTLAAVVILIDPRRSDRTAYLAHFHAANEPEATARLLDHLRDELARLGSRRLLGPVGLSPHLGSGLLLDHWHLYPPANTPYNPPYLPELADQFMRPLRPSYLYHIDIAVPAGAAPAQESGAGPATLEPLPVERLAADLLPLWAAAVAEGDAAAFPLPDGDEAAFLLRWLDAASLTGWLARVDGEAAGFLLLQADLGARLRRAGGGRHWPGRAWLALSRRRPVAQGRLLFGGVLPRFRRRGIGRQLWRQALRSAAQAGWRELTIGPIVEAPLAAPSARAASRRPAGKATPAAAAAFLEQQGARRRQSYALYEYAF